MIAKKLSNFKNILGIGLILFSICQGYSIANCAEFQHPTKYRYYKGFFNEDRCLDGTKYTHEGLDIVGYKGENIRGAEVKPFAKGTVEKVGEDSSYGHYVIIDHGGGLKTKYGHLLAPPDPPHVKKGQGITTLDKKIGEIDSTGKSQGDHLHFQVELNGKPVDPFYFLPRDEFTCRSERMCCNNHE
jgi:murein DD-endopeptidase MepM/ murein hydrolase activator NlpD